MPEALARFRESAAIMDRLVKIDGSLSEWQKDAAAAHYWVGETLLAMGDADAARHEAVAAIAGGEQLLDQVPGEREAIAVVGDAYIVLGQIADHTGAGAESIVAFRRAVEVLEPVAGETTDKTYLDPWARAVLHLDRVDDARPVVRTIAQDGL